MPSTNMVRCNKCGLMIPESQICVHVCGPTPDGTHLKTTRSPVFVRNEDLGPDPKHELIEVQRTYIKGLCAELEELVALAHVHGWRSTRYELGVELRDKIAKLEEKIYGQPRST